MYRPEYGVRDAHKQIHIISPHCIAGIPNNPLEPIIEEATRNPDGKFVLHQMTELSEAENLFKRLVARNKLRKYEGGELMDLIFIDDFGPQFRQNTWIQKRLPLCRHPATEHANVMILVQMVGNAGGLHQQS